jgi:hypothetical protein
MKKMKSATLPVMKGNEVSINDYATDIRAELTKSTTAWKRIAEIFLAAQEQFGRMSKEMRELGKQTGFEKSKIDKLVLIAKSTRIKENDNLFGTVTAWTVLYDVTRLNDAQFDELKEKLLEGFTLTSKLVLSIKNPRPTPNPVQMQGVATIQIDINAIRSGVVDMEDYEFVVKSLQEIAERVPFIKITFRDVLSKDIEKRESEVIREYEIVARKKFIDARTKFLNRIRAKYGATICKKRETEIRDQTQDLLRGNGFKEAFELIESDQFDEGKILNEASSRVWERRKEKFGEKVSEPYGSRNIIQLSAAA